MKGLTAVAVLLLTSLCAVPMAAGQDVVARLSDPAMSGLGSPDATTPALRDDTRPILDPQANSYFSEIEAERIRQAVRGQILALASHDASAAFALLAPSVKDFYADPHTFVSALTKDLSPILKSDRFALAELERDSIDAVQLVQFTQADGAQWLARFTVERQPNGAWAIKRCLVEPGSLAPRA